MVSHYQHHVHHIYTLPVLSLFSTCVDSSMISAFSECTRSLCSASRLPYNPILYQGSSNSRSMLSRLRPAVSGTVNRTHTPPTIVTAAKNQKVPRGVIPWGAGSSMLGTARELPYWFTKCSVMAIEVANARMRSGKSSAVSKYYIICLLASSSSSKQ